MPGLEIKDKGLILPEIDSQEVTDLLEGNVNSLLRQRLFLERNSKQR